MSLSFGYVNPNNSDTEILNDYYTLHSMDTRTSPDVINKVLKKYGFPEETDNQRLFNNVEEFKHSVDSDVSLTWRRVKMLDVGTLGNIENFLDRKEGV